MSNDDTRAANTGTHLPVNPESRLTYVMASMPPAAVGGDDIDFLRIWDAIWNGRWLIAGITSFFAIGAIVYALLAPPWYDASVLLAPTKDRAPAGLVGQLGSLVSLAGITPNATDSIEAVAVLRSRDFARAFIEDQELMPVLFADEWDAAGERWKLDKPPDIRKAVRLFDRRVRRVNEDRRTGLVTLSIQWKDPRLAASWANLLAARLNEHMRQRALTEAEASVKYLRRELESTTVVALQQSIARLLENELQRLTLARGNAEYAFRIIDRAEVPRNRSTPRRALIVACSVLLGSIVSMLAVFVRSSMRRRARVADPTGVDVPPVRSD